MHHPSIRRRSACLVAVTVAAVALTGCGSSTGAATGTTAGSGTVGSSTAGPATGSTAGSSTAGSSTTGTADPSASSTTRQAGGTVTLVTHDSFAMDKSVIAAFEKDSGITLKIIAQGDAGAMVNQLVLTKNKPLGDVSFGVDSTFASRALDAGVFAEYVSPEAKNGSDKYSIDGQNRLTAVDFGDVCINQDKNWFAQHQVAAPTSYEDLTKPEYKNLLVVPSPATSSPGLAFLLGTIAHFGADKWQGYWQQLKDNGVKITAGWNDAYTVDFSGSSGKGDRPLVLSYASSPPYEVPKGGTTAPTAALLDTCYRQVEYVGVLAGAQNPAGARALVDFMLSKEFQDALPGNMYVYPVSTTATLPADWAKFAPVAKNPAQLDPQTVSADREQWISAWSDLMEG